jgi:hypothetical protein
LLAAPDLPSIVHPEILSNSVVRVLVNRLGFTFSPALLSTSGSAKADTLALDLAKAVRFHTTPKHQAGNPVDDWTLTSGHLIFQWHTVPDTNYPPATPSP